LRSPSGKPLRSLFLRGHIWLVATVIPLSVKVFSISRLTRLLTPPAWLHPYAGIPAEQIAASVAHRLRNPRVMRRRACLREGLTLFHFLRLAALPAVLRISVYPPSQDPQRLHAHCWITVGDNCLSAPATGPAAVVFTTEAGGQVTE